MFCLFWICICPSQLASSEFIADQRNLPHRTWHFWPWDVQRLGFHGTYKYGGLEGDLVFKPLIPGCLFLFFSTEIKSTCTFEELKGCLFGWLAFSWTGNVACGQVNNVSCTHFDLGFQVSLYRIVIFIVSPPMDEVSFTKIHQKLMYPTSKGPWVKTRIWKRGSFISKIWTPLLWLKLVSTPL